MTDHSHTHNHSPIPPHHLATPSRPTVTPPNPAVVPAARPSAGPAGAGRSTTELQAAALAGDCAAELVLRDRALDDPEAAEAYRHALEVLVAQEVSTGRGPAPAAVTAVCDQITAAVRDILADDPSAGSGVPRPDRR